MDLKSSSLLQHENVKMEIEEEEYGTRLNDMSKKFIANCVAEKKCIGEGFPLTAMLLDEAMDKVFTTGRIPGRGMHVDVFKQKPIKLTQKVFVPIKQFPKFNFSGKILGPKGNSLRRLEKKTMCKIKIKGRNSSRNTEKEEELRISSDPQHAHFNKDLYVEISTVANPAKAYARVAYSLAEIRKFLIPDKNDEVSKNQLKEIMADPEYPKKAAIYAEKNNVKSFNKGYPIRKPNVSILEKLMGKTEEKPELVKHEYEYEVEGNTLNADCPMRQVSQKPAGKRPLQQPAQQIQRYEYSHKRGRDISIGIQPRTSAMEFF